MLPSSCYGSYDFNRKALLQWFAVGTWFILREEKEKKKKKKNSLISDKLTNAWCKLTHERRVFEGDHVVMYNVFNLLGIGWIEYELWSTVLSKKENDEHCPGVESLEFTHL